MLYIIQGEQSKSKLIYDHGEEIISYGIISFINHWCVLNGSTYVGRKEAACALLHIQQKPPILISNRTRDLLFPLYSVRRIDNIWLNYRGIYSCRRLKEGTCVQFLNEKEYCFNVDIRSIRREMKLCEELYERMQLHR